MGTKMGPSYVIVGCIENQIFDQLMAPNLYGRYIDGCIGIISSSREELDHFITFVDSFQSPRR